MCRGRRTHFRSLQMFFEIYPANVVPDAVGPGEVAESIRRVDSRVRWWCCLGSGLTIDRPSRSAVFSKPWAIRSMAGGAVATFVRRPLISPRLPRRSGSSGRTPGDVCASSVGAVAASSRERCHVRSRTTRAWSSRWEARSRHWVRPMSALSGDFSPGSGSGLQLPSG